MDDHAAVQGEHGEENGGNLKNRARNLETTLQQSRNRTKQPGFKNHTSETRTKCLDRFEMPWSYRAKRKRLPLGNVLRRPAKGTETFHPALDPSVRHINSMS